MEEIEISFLPKSLPKNLKEFPSRNILDIYIPAKMPHPFLRIRKHGDKYEMTKKQPVKDDDFSQQLETTIPLTKEEFNDLNQLEGKRVQKTRYYYEENGTKYEIGVFEGPLEGLVVVDVEFTSRQEMDSFKIPSWCLIDVTQEELFAGGVLCGKKYSDIEKQLKGFGYEKISMN